MSMLIDEAISIYGSNEVEIDGEWYIAKPITYNSIINNIKNAWSCLIGKSFAVHFKEDEI